MSSGPEREDRRGSSVSSPQAASPVSSTVRSSHCQLRSTPSPGVSFGKASSGEGLLLSGEPVCLRGGCLSCLPQPREQRRSPALVLLRVRGETWGGPLALCDAQFPLAEGGSNLH